MTRRAIAVATVLGIAIGAGSVIGWEMFGQNTYPNAPLSERLKADHRDYSGADAMPRAALARALFSRVAPTFVADTRRKGSLPYGIGFYAKPKWAGEILCRVDLVEVPGKVVRGYTTRNDDPWDDDLKIVTLYGIRRKPGGPVEDDAAREAACTNYNDFDELIHGDNSIVVERGVNVLDKAANLAKAGQINFTIECEDRRQNPRIPTNCDGAAILRAVNLKDIQQVDSISETESTGLSRHVDQIFMRATRGKGCGRREMMMLKIVSTQTYGRQSAEKGDPTEVEIAQDVIC